MKHVLQILYSFHFLGGVFFLRGHPVLICWILVCFFMHLPLTPIRLAPQSGPKVRFRDVILSSLCITRKWFFFGWCMHLISLNGCHLSIWYLVLLYKSITPAPICSATWVRRQVVPLTLLYWKNYSISEENAVPYSLTHLKIVVILQIQILHSLLNTIS